MRDRRIERRCRRRLEPQRCIGHRHGLRPGDGSGRRRRAWRLRRGLSRRRGRSGRCGLRRRSGRRRRTIGSRRSCSVTSCRRRCWRRVTCHFRSRIGTGRWGRSGSCLCATPKCIGAVVRARSVGRERIGCCALRVGRRRAGRLVGNCGQIRLGSVGVRGRRIWRESVRVGRWSRVWRIVADQIRDRRTAGCACRDRKNRREAHQGSCHARVPQPRQKTPCPTVYRRALPVPSRSPCQDGEIL